MNTHPHNSQWRQSLRQKVWRFLASEDGPTTVEYCVMLMLVMLACLTAITSLGQGTAASYTNSVNSINKAMGK